MSPRDEHQRFEELAVGYALSALEPEDDQDFRAHLAACARCERDVDDHVATLAELACLADPADPPDELLEGIRAELQSSGEPSSAVSSSAVSSSRRPASGTPTSGSAAVPAGSSAGAPSSPGGAAAGGVFALDDARRARDARRYRRAAAVTGAAAALALAASVAGWAALRGEGDPGEGRGADLSTTAQALAGDGATTVPLAREDGQVLAVAVLEPASMTLVVEGLEPNEADTTSYVVWGQSRSGEVRAVGVFDVTSEDVGVHEGMALPEGAAELAALLVTREPTDEPPAVTSQPVLVSGQV